MFNICHVQFTILFYHSYNSINRNIPIFHNFKAQIQVTPNFGYQLFSPCKMHEFRQTDGQINRQTTTKGTDRKTDQQTDNNKSRQTVTDKSKSLKREKFTNSDRQTDRESSLQTTKQTDSYGDQRIVRQKRIN